ncbi:hypothetical protein [Heyndrickxia ginsengihumi]|nr:hypothetical protein [Heyndrickxia ginsengihumi]
MIDKWLGDDTDYSNPNNAIQFLIDVYGFDYKEARNYVCTLLSRREKEE